MRLSDRGSAELARLRSEFASNRARLDARPQEEKDLEQARLQLDIPPPEGPPAVVKVPPEKVPDPDETAAYLKRLRQDKKRAIQESEGQKPNLNVYVKSMRSMGYEREQALG